MSKRKPMTPEERAFVRGFCAAVAEFERHHVNAEDLLKDISATERMLTEADVDEFDKTELVPVLRRVRRARRVIVARRRSFRPLVS